MCSSVNECINGILFNHRKKTIMPFATVWMDFEGIMFSETSLKEKKKILCDIIDM